MHVIVLLVLLLLPVSTAHAQARDTGASILRPGDRVEITVWGRSELSGTFDITAEGTVNHPLLSEIQIAGIHSTEARALLRGHLSRYIDTPQFTMTPLLRVGVGGEVRQPSLYTLKPETTVAEAVATAGGGTPNARMNRVRLIREGTVSTLDLTASNSTLASSYIRSGDQIFVDRKTNVFRDYIAPAGSIASALVGMLNFVF
jgi:polysaccharide biosynthesis/export protein